MKLCWDNINRLKFSIITGNWRNGNNTYFLKECGYCGEEYLGCKNQEYCDSSCQALAKPPEKHSHWKGGEEFHSKDRTASNKASRNWARKNRDYYSSKCAERRAKKLNQTPEDADQEKIRWKYWMRDRLNIAAGRIAFHVDHITALANGGLHHEDNLQVLPAITNLIKGARI